MNLVRAIRSERGSAAVFVVGAFLALLLVVGMSVDLGIFLRYRRAMQNACDAGVLAGGLNLRSSPDTAAPTAERYATNDMTNNAISWSSIVVTTQDNNGNPTLISPRRIRAIIQSDVPTYFWRLVNPSVHVAVSCAARITPVILTQGLVPVGLNYAEWAPLYDPTTGGPCAQYVSDGTPIEDRPALCQSYAITANISDRSNPWGSGNTGLLSMNCFDCTGGGADHWLRFFLNGAPMQFCYDPNRTAPVGDYQINGEPCASVRTEPGADIGALQAGVNGRGPVDGRCESPPPPDSLDRIIMMPLLNPAYVDGPGGTYTTEIWGFAAFQLDCSGERITGHNPTIDGAFVSIVTMQAYGQETEFETGVWTVRLVE
jgi:hypothetical protein